jgi:hypothetical protein
MFSAAFLDVESCITDRHAAKIECASTQRQTSMDLFTGAAREMGTCHNLTFGEKSGARKGAVSPRRCCAPSFDAPTFQPTITSPALAMAECIR